MGSPVMDEQSREQAKDSTPKPQPVVWSLEAGDVVQLVRTLPCHGRGRGFESRRPRHSFLAALTSSRDVRGR